MGIVRRFCHHHPDRPAIGICVITHEAICGECSTRYEGVNYSREGLRILQQRRTVDSSRSKLEILALVLAPLALLLMYGSYLLNFKLLMQLMHWDFSL